MARFGLRTQIVLALTVAFLVAFSLLGTLTLELSRQSRAHARQDDALAAANALAVSMDRNPSRSAFLQNADAVIGRGGIRGVEFLRPSTDDDIRPPTWERGVAHLGSRVVDDIHGTTILWLRAPPGDGSSLGKLLLLYVSITMGLILLLTFWTLTRLIVRPIEQITLAAKRLAAGRLETALPTRGAAEVVMLSESFNKMAFQLSAERTALEQRLVELEKTTRELETAERQVERSAHLASVGRLAAGVAHEIGNPLTAIAGLVEIAQDEDLPATRRTEFLKRAEKETSRIHRIIRELLDFARPDAEPSNERLAMGDVVAAAVHLVAPQQDTNKIRIEQRVDADAYVVANLDRLTQVLLNLLLNAADAVDGEGEILVEAYLEEEHVVLAVTDTGTGIPDNVFQTLFEPFVTSKPVGKGTGLGLAVCHTIIERLGGHMEAYNVEDGARFEVWLKVAPAHEAT